MKRLPIFLAVTLMVLAALALVAPQAVRAYWEWRASNPVRRGLVVAERSGCFSCHGPLGSAGVLDPGLHGGSVPRWIDGEWAEFVEDAAGVREYVLRGSALRREAPEAAKPSPARGFIEMPGYAGRLSDAQVLDVVAAFLVVSGMSGPPEGTPTAAGYGIARRHGCFACHGPAGAGGQSNPGSLAGFVPGWYGADFGDLVADRGEFDAWIREGRNARIEASTLRRAFLARQAIRMPAYRDIDAADLEALWEYAAWLGDTRGGIGPDLEGLRR